ncbi:MAG: ATP-binding protein, partial [Nitrospira sp.]
SEERIQTRPQGVRVLHTKKIAICDGEGRPQYLVGISEDITEQKETEKILQGAHAELEQRVIDRTTELTATNAALHDVSGRLIHAQEEERSRIARDLHDDVCQQLVLMAIELEDLELRPPSSGLQVSARCRGLWAKTREISAILHRLSRDLHPSKLDHLGLDTAVRSLCTDITRLHHVTIAYSCHGVPDALPKTVALSLYRVTQEALHNVVKHSRAREAQVEIFADAGMLSLTVSDAGTGFTLNQPNTRAGLGMTSMEERVRWIGGRLVIRSLPSRGTTITVQVPLTTSTV